MSVSDLVITKPGGLTTTESLASGLPLIIIDPLPGQEEENAEFIENSGAGIVVKDNEVTSGKLIGIIESLFNDQESLLVMKQACVKIGKPNSSQLIADLIIKLAKKERFSC